MNYRHIFSRINLFLFYSFLIVSIFCGCYKEDIEHNSIEKSKTVTESQEESTMDQDVELLINEIGIDKDCANGIVIELREVGASALKKVTLISKERGYQAKVEDFNGNVYYIGLGSLGYLEYIRENSGDGKLLFFVTDD